MGEHFQVAKTMELINEITIKQIVLNTESIHAALGVTAYCLHKFTEWLPTANVFCPGVLV